MSIKLIFEKYRALIALVIKFYYRWDLSYTLIQVTTLPSTNIQIYFCF